MRVSFPMMELCFGERSGRGYLVRGGKLCCVAMMRSQSAYAVLPYDACLFMCIQSYLAASLDIPTGSYHHICSSIHIYEDEIELAGKAIQLGANPVEFGSMAGPDAE